MLYYTIRRLMVLITIGLIPVIHLFGQVGIYLDVDESKSSYGAIIVSDLDEEAAAYFTNINSKEDWQKHLNIIVLKADLDPEQTPSMWGKYKLAHNQIIFTPRFPLIEGNRYRVSFNYKEGVTEIIDVPQITELEPTRVVNISPSEWPENVLKLYIQFSAPMRRGEALKNIILLNDEGDIETPFLDIGYELWNKDNTRLTLWFDPGRIKRYLQPNEKYGPPLEKGREYSFVIKKDWKDANGQKLEEGIVNSYRILDADRTKPNPDTWKIDYPSRGLDNLLRITFPESMDRALLESHILVLDAHEQEVKGEVQVSTGERRWRFYPDDKWKPGKYRIRVSTRLEDVAGNNLRRLFDRDIEKNEKEAKDYPPFIDFEFELK